MLNRARTGRQREHAAVEVAATGFGAAVQDLSFGVKGATTIRFVGDGREDGVALKRVRVCETAQSTLSLRCYR